MKHGGTSDAALPSEHDSRRLRIALGSHHYGRVKNVVLSWNRFRGGFVKERRDGQLFATYQKLSKKQREPFKNRVGFFVGGPCEGGVRTARTVKERDLLTLDFDGLDPDVYTQLTLVDAPLQWNYEAAWHTTRSHHSTDIRVRFAAPLARPVDRAEYSALVAILAAKVDPNMQGFDAGSAEPERLMFLGTVCADGEFSAGHIRGALIDPDDLLKPFRDDEGKIEWDHLPSLPGTKLGGEAPAPVKLPPTLETGDDDNLIAAHNLRSGRSLKQLSEILNAIPNDQTDNRLENRDVWLKLGAAFHYETGGSEEAFEVFDKWCKQHPKYSRENNRKLWLSFRDDTSVRKLATIGTLLSFARRNGQQLPAEADSPLGAYGELWFGERFADRFRGRAVYVPETGQWLRWTGVSWAAMAAPELDALAKGVAEEEMRSAFDNFRTNPSEVTKAALNKAVRFHESLAKVRNIAESAASVPGMWASLSEFDRDPMLIGVGNAVIDLRKGHCLQPDPEQRISKQAGVLFDPNATCPKFHSFLATVQPSPAVREFLQRAIGYTLTGLVDEEDWFLLIGTGANGKSVLANVMSAMMGEYAVTLGSALVTRNKHENEAERMKARLPGHRLALVNEVAQGDVWDDQRMKEITSREKISARLLHHEGFDFMPTHKLWVRGNHLPGALDAGHGFWRRILPIPFLRQLQENEIIPDLDRQIITMELPGVLNWAIAGCLKWQRDGLKVPLAVRAMAAEYREETDLIGLWFAERCESNPEARTLVSDAFESFRRFCAEQGVSHGSKMAFTRTLKARGIESAPSHKHGRAYVGFSILSAFSDVNDGEELL